MTTIGLVLRVRHLAGHQGLSGDEAFVLALAQRPFWHMLSLFRFEANGILYPLVMWPLARLGDSVGLLRLPALITGTMAIPCLYWVGKRLSGWKAGFVGASLLALSPLGIAYSQIARPYSFALLFGILSFGCLDRALAQQSSRTWWLLYLGAMAGGLYSNALTVTLLLPHGLLLFRYPSSTRVWLRWLGLLAVASVPLAVLLAWEHSRRDPLYWLDPPSFQALRRTATQFAVDQQGLRLTVIFVVVALASIAVSGRRNANLLGDATIAAWAVVPALALFAASHAVTPLFWIGYLLPMLPGVFLLIGAAAERSPAPIAAIAVVGLIFISAHSSVKQPDRFHPLGWEQASAALAADRQPADPVVFDIPDGLGPAGYYDPTFAGPHGQILVSEWHDEPVPAVVALLDDPGGYGEAPIGPPTQNEMKRLAKRTGNVFVMLYEINRQGSSELWPGIRWARRHCAVATTDFGETIEMIAARDCHLN